MKEENSTPIVIYENADQTVEVCLDANNQTIWLIQLQMAEAFDTSTDNIGLHLKNIYKEGKRQVTRSIKKYNLDAIVSVGYRVNSIRATRFRQWATRILREHLTQGWTINRQRFEENARELEAALTLVRKVAHSPALDMDSGRGLVDIVSRYAQTFLLLQRYDEGLLNDPQSQAGGTSVGLCDQEPPVLRCQQAQRGLSVRGFSASQQSPV
jgi:hypothetical protein